MRRKIDGEMVEVEDLEKKGKGKGKDIPEEKKRNMVNSILSKMSEAAKEDFLARKNNQPAVAKLKLLPEVRITVANTKLQDTLLEGTGLGIQNNNTTILTVIKEWLRPLPGAELPNLQLREELYNILNRLPISLDHLRESRIGPILAALAEHPKETESNRLLLKSMVDRFSRQIFHKTASYRGNLDTALAAQAAIGLVSAPKIPLPVVPVIPTTTTTTTTHDAVLANSDSTNLDLDHLLEAKDSFAHLPPALQPRHARIPTAIVMDFVHRPMNDNLAPKAKPKVGQGSLELQKRMSELRKSKNKKIERGMKISIEGRGTAV